MQHGIDCKKEAHGDAKGYLHAPDYDGPYDIDGVEYCGRCHYAIAKTKPMTPNIELAARKCAEDLWSIVDPDKLAWINRVATIITRHIATHTQSLETRLAYAEDALAKNDLARQNAGGMEMRIGELEEENKRLREALGEAMRTLKAEFGDVNWRIKDINNALTKPT